MVKKVTALFISSCLAVLAAGIQPSAASASAGGTLFAVFGETQIVALDPTTGGMTTVADLTDPSLQFGSTIDNLVSDAAHHRLFGDQVRFNFDPDRVPAFFETYQIVTVDTQTGAFTTSPDMPQRLNLAFDSSTGVLFGLTTECCPFQVFRVDSETGGEALLATIAGETQVSNLAIAPALHVLYVAQRTPDVFPATSTLLAIDTATGAITTGPPLDRGIFLLAYESSSSTLYGKTFSIPSQQVVSITTATGTETPIGAFDLGFGGNSLTINPSTHTIYVMKDDLGAFGFNQFVGAIDAESGAVAFSPAIPLTGYIRSLAFEAVVVTPAQLLADLQAAIVAGDVNNAGVAAALRAQLQAAQAARDRGQCAMAANLYEAFISTVTAQAGNHVSGTAASHLISEAKAVSASCP
jgi:hypothetical protein